MHGYGEFKRGWRDRINETNLKQTNVLLKNAGQTMLTIGNYDALLTTTTRIPFFVYFLCQLGKLLFKSL